MSVRICIQNIFDAVESHHSDWWSDQVDQILFDPPDQSPGSLFEIQEPQIYTFNAYSDTIHIFIPCGDNRLCSFTNQGELYADVPGKSTTLGRWLCFGPSADPNVWKAFQ